MALSESGIGRNVDFGPDGRVVLEPQREDRVERAIRRGSFTLLQGGLAVGDVVKIDEKYLDYGRPDSRGVDPEDGKTYDAWVRNTEMLGDDGIEWVVRDADGVILEQQGDEKVYF